MGTPFSWILAASSAIALLVGSGCADRSDSAQNSSSAPSTRNQRIVERTSAGVRAGFRQALPGYEFSFPRDHGAHPAFATEWWYYTGHLRARDGRRFGYQLTWFRTALAPRIDRSSNWATRDVMFAHFALTDEAGRRFFFSDRIGRANMGAHGAQSQVRTPRIWCGDWTLHFSGDAGSVQDIRALAASDAPDTRGQTFGLQLRLNAAKPPVVHGRNGVSQKSAGAGRASHYYSFTRLEATGILTLGDQRMQVEGESWFDHEFGSGQLAPNQVGWDWFSLQFEDGRELMLYRLRLADGGTEPFSSGTLVQRNGTARHLELREFSLQPSGSWKSPLSGGVYPQRWSIAVPGEALRLEVEPAMPQQELVPARSGADLAYWEGSVTATGRWRSSQVKARGYLEMTGYARPFNARF